MPATLNLVNASVGKRSGAKLLDAVPALIVSSIGMLLAFGPVNGIVVTSVAALLCLAYWIWQWGWEATRGNTVGNAILGVRTTNLEGFHAGWGSIFVRGLIIWAGSLVLLVGALVVLISNLWDLNGRRQGWHDKAAKTYVFDIRVGRNPMVTGGVSGPETFAPAPLPASMQRAATKDPHEQTTGSGPDTPPSTKPMSSPVISAVPDFAPEMGNSSDAVPAPRTSPASAAGWVPTAEPTPVADAAPQAGPAPVAKPSPQADPAPVAKPSPDEDRSLAPHPDDDVEATRITRRAAKPRMRLVFDDGRELELRSAALVGRNPAGRPSEAVDQLIDVPDQGRSVSKTHLHLRVEASTVWVTDRNSTNGSAISTPDGTRTDLHPGEAIRVDAGSTVHFGDRSFLVGPA